MSDIIRPNADLASVGTVTPTGGSGGNYGAINEASPDVANFVTVTGAGNFDVGLAAPAGSPGASQVFSYEISTDTGGVNAVLEQRKFPAIILHGKWTQHPGVFRPINGASPLSQKLAGAWNFATEADGVIGKIITRGAGASRSASNYGAGVKVAGTSNLSRCVLNNSGADTPGASDFTVACLFQLDATSGYSAVAKWNTGASASTDDWFLGANNQFSGTTADFLVAVGSTVYAASIASTSWTAGTTYLLVGRRKGTTIYIDRHDYTNRAKRSASTANAGITTINSNASRVTKLGEIDAGASLNANTTTAFVGMWGRSISDSEILELIANPWQLFAPVKRTIYFETRSPVATINHPSAIVTPTQFDHALTSGEMAAITAPTKLAMRFEQT